jgi:hypothetical protein
MGGIDHYRCLRLDYFPGRPRLETELAPMMEDRSQFRVQLTAPEGTFDAMDPNMWTGFPTL